MGVEGASVGIKWMECWRDIWVTDSVMLTGVNYAQLSTIILLKVKVLGLSLRPPPELCPWAPLGTPSVGSLGKIF